MQNKKTQVIAVYSPKGGTGKTTMTVHLAHELARKGDKVLVVDMAQFGNVASHHFRPHGISIWDETGGIVRIATPTPLPTPRPPARMAGRNCPHPCQRRSLGTDPFGVGGRNVLR